MGRSKSALKKRKFPIRMEEPSTEDEIPIPNLPTKYPLMHVKSGSKIRNILKYALNEYPKYGCIVWTAAGQGIGKAISCVEIFKKKHQGLHQITKLRYIVSKNSKTTRKESDSKGETAKNVDNKSKPNNVPEIHILLATEIKDTNEPGYQPPENRGEFSNSQEIMRLKIGAGSTSASNVTCIDAKEFAAMGLRTGQKRPKKELQTEATPRKKNKGKSITSSSDQ